MFQSIPALAPELYDIQVRWEKLINTCNTGQEVEDFFVAQGVKGVPCVMAACPIATYLQGDTRIEVTVGSIIGLHIRPTRRGFPINFGGFDHTEATKEFVREFDGHPRKSLLKF